MSFVTLLNYDPAPVARATFAFDHMNAHRNYFGIMAPLDRFSVLPYILDPMQRDPNPSGPWHLNHQQAHDDALTSIPVLYGSPHVGLFVGQNVRDADLQNRWQRSTWTFQNHMEHYIANASVLPMAGTDWRWPFW